MNKDFKQFLIDNKAYDEFVQMLSKRNRTLDKYIKGLNSHKHRFIMSAFKWDETPSGNDFWEAICLKWWDLFKPSDVKEYTALLTFLDNEKLKDKFIKNAKKYSSEKMYKYLPYAIPADKYIKCAFPWDKTDIGGLGWFLISEHWRMTINPE